MTTAPNRICSTTVQPRRLSVAEAEVWVTARVAAVTPTTELRGRLVGPRRPGVSTVEVAYPFRPLPGPRNAAEASLTVRVLIPEPNLWTEAAPNVYEGPLELWQDGRCCDTARVAVALKAEGKNPS